MAAECSATVYEASSWPGGRVHTATGATAPEMTTEFGGEFAGASHKWIPGFAKWFGLEWIETAAGVIEAVELRFRLWRQ